MTKHANERVSSKRSRIQYAFDPMATVSVMSVHSAYMCVRVMSAIVWFIWWIKVKITVSAIWIDRNSFTSIVRHVCLSFAYVFSFFFSFAFIICRYLLHIATCTWWLYVISSLDGAFRFGCSIGFMMTPTLHCLKNRPDYIWTLTMMHITKV